MSVMSLVPPSRRCTGSTGNPFLLVLAVVMIHAPGAWSHDGDSGTVRFAIENATDQDIRCVAQLAHFVTVDLPLIAPGATHQLDLVRQERGSLALGASGGAPMMLENLLCGTDTDWSASVDDISLLAVKGEERHAWTVRCTEGGGRLLCEP